MSPERYDVVVVGAGPAGSATAIGLAHEGADVLLVERADWPRWKVCGACLNAGTVEMLGDLGAGHLVDHPEARTLSAVSIRSGKRCATLPLQGSLALPRRVMDRGLVDEAIRHGVHFEAPARAEALEPTPDGDAIDVRVRSESGSRRVRAAVAVVAAGLGGGSRLEFPKSTTVGDRVGLGAVFPAESGAFAPGVIHMTMGEGGYVGAVVTGDGKLTVAAAIERDFLRSRGSPESAVRATLAATGLTLPTVAPLAGWSGTPALTRRAESVAGHRIFAVGDAAGYVEPFTGEGMAWALAGARVLTPIVAKAAHHWTPEAVHRWTDVHRETIGSAQTVCRAVAWSSRRPWVTSGVLALLSCMPGLATPFLRTTRTIPHSGGSWAWT